MLNLVVTDLAGTSHVLDLYKDEPIRLNYQASDLVDISRVTGNYSQTFRLPATAANKAFFGGFSEPGIHTSSDGSINGTFSVKKKTLAVLVKDTLPLMNGYIKVEAAIIMGGRQPDYSVTFFGETPAFGSELSGKLLTDLSTAVLDNDVNYSNVTGSWTGTDADDHSIRWGLFDKGVAMQFDVEEDTKVYQAEMVPYLSLHWIWNKIFSDAGFSYTSTWIDDNTGEFKKMYMPLWNGTSTPLGDEVPEDEIAGAAVQSSQTITGTLLWQKVELTDSSTYGGYDPGSNWTNTGTDEYTYTIPWSGYYTIEYSLRPSGGDIVAVAITVDGAQLDGTVSYAINSATTLTFTERFVQGQKIALEVQNATPNNTATLYPANVGFTNQGAWLRVLEVSNPLSGYEVGFGRNFPEMKQIDFITSLQKMFNLVIYPSRSDPKNLVIEPYPVWADSYSVKDWSNKVDYTKDIVLEPSTKYQSAKYQWKYSSGNDVINKGVEEQLQRVYGEYEVLDPENDFAKGETTVEVGFVPHVSNSLSNSTGAVFKGIDEQGVAIKKAQPLIAYWNGALSGMGQWSLYNDSNVATNQTTMPLFTMYNAFPPTVTSYSLEFKSEFAFHLQEARPLNTLYYSYWSRFANELYSSQARFMTCFIKLTAADISSFLYSDRIYVDNQYWRIQTINGYDPTASSSCKVVLKLVLDDISDCEFTPSAVDDNGVITFTNQAGATGQVGSQVCCEKYGYTWVNRKAAPYQACITPTIQLQ